MLAHVVYLSFQRGCSSWWIIRFKHDLKNIPCHFAFLVHSTSTFLCSTMSMDSPHWFNNFGCYIKLRLNRMYVLLMRYIDYYDSVIDSFTDVQVFIMTLFVVCSQYMKSVIHGNVNISFLFTSPGYYLDEWPICALTLSEKNVIRKLNLHIHWAFGIFQYYLMQNHSKQKVGQS